MASMRAWRWPSKGTRYAFWALLVFNALLSVQAIATGALEVTSGRIVAGGIAATVAATLALRLVPLPEGPVARAQVVFLAGSALHAIGHLWRIYHAFPNYDDAFHFAAGIAVGLVILDFARSPRFVIPAARLGPTRVAVLLVVSTVAIAGLWEIFEYVGDLAMGTQEQDNLHDTMQDMIDGLAGGLVAGVIAWRRLRNDAAPARERQIMRA